MIFVAADRPQSYPRAPLFDYLALQRFASISTASTTIFHTIFLIRFQDVLNYMDKARRFPPHGMAKTKVGYAALILLGGKGQWIECRRRRRNVCPRPRRRGGEEFYL